MVNKERLISLRLQFLGYAEIGRQLGISRQRVEALIKVLGKDRPELLFPTKGHRNGTKKCSICKQWLPLTQFPRNKYQWDGLNTYCRICSARKKREYYKRHRIKSNCIPKVIDSMWFNTAQGSFGIVVGENETGKRQLYAGVVSGLDQKADEEAILSRGKKVNIGTLKGLIAKTKKS